MDALVPHAMIVEYPEDQRKLLAKLLLRQGLRVAEKNSAADASAQGFTNLAVIFVDTNLKDMHALKFVKSIRSLCPSEFTKICLISDQLDKITLAQGTEAGCDDFLVKPIDPDSVLLKITKLIGQKATPHAWSAVSYNATLHANPIQPELKIVRITDRGVVLSSSASIIDGSTIQLDSSRLAKVIGRESSVVQLQARRCLREKPGFYLVDCELVALTPQDQNLLIQAIRAV